MSISVFWFRRDLRLNDNAGFWVRMGFEEVARTPTRFWHTYFPNERIDVVARVRKL